MAKPPRPSLDPDEKGKAGRRPDPRPKLELRLPPEDYAVLKRVEARTSLAPEEVARMLVHIAIWETQGMLPAPLREALNQARRSGDQPVVERRVGDRRAH